MVSEVKTVTGRGVPLIGNDIDTDRIIPARFLRCVTFDGLGEQVFADDRSHAEGNHPFDQPSYQEASILVVNRNFGCGSSREHAPQALAKWGIQAIVGESFAEIFFGNCVAMGIPCVVADPADVQTLQSWIASHPETEVSIDLDTMAVRFGSDSISVRMGEGARSMFLSGTWDACGQLVSHADAIHQTVAKLPYIAWSQAAS